MHTVTLEQARAAKQTVHRIFTRFGTVVGVGITRVHEGYAVKVNVSRPLPPEADVPSEVDGVPICVEVVGVIRSR